MAFKIYTKTGDQGETGLFGGRRLPKSHIRIDAYGTVDELNSWIGLLVDLLADEGKKAQLQAIQTRLFTIGSNLASDPEKELSVPDILPSDIESMEHSIDEMEQDLPPLKNFILPGGHPAVSHCHITRCVCRRAERLVVALSLSEAVDGMLIQYLNRLSDLLFVMARHIGWQLGVGEIAWKPRG